MAHTRAAAAWVTVVAIVQGFSLGVECSDRASALHIFLTGKPRMAAHAAILGALRRLARPECQQLFADFADGSGNALLANLEVRGTTAADYFAGLYFAEGDDSAQCHIDETTAAFTTPHSRVIHVCGTRFADRFARKTMGGEILLIHELLHALGLGENPPTSAQITRLVWARCAA